jgi:hypothetical protein
MDSPMGYCCRITRSRLLSIPTSPSQVTSELLPLLSVLIQTKVSTRFHNDDVALMLLSNQGFFIKEIVVKVIEEVDKHGLCDDDLEESLVNAFHQEPAMPGSPKRKTIVLPRCNITPTKRKHNNVS